MCTCTPCAMAELEAERVKLARRDRKEANGLLDAVNAQDVPRVTHLLAIGVNPDARVDNARGGAVFFGAVSTRPVSAYCSIAAFASVLLMVDMSTTWKGEEKPSVEPLPS